jgi:hypothetical protein
MLRTDQRKESPLSGKEMLAELSQKGIPKQVYQGVLDNTKMEKRLDHKVENPALSNAELDSKSNSDWIL